LEETSQEAKEGYRALQEETIEVKNCILRC